MSNRIVEIEIKNKSLMPATAELVLHVLPESMNSTTELRGKLMGPQCAYATTIELAYPLQGIERTDTAFRATIKIPEASLWNPISPFLYRGVVELLEDGVSVDRQPIQHGLRHVSVTAKGLFVNGRALTLKVKRVAELQPAMMTELREQDVNALIVPIAQCDDKTLELLDHWGSFLVPEITEEDIDPEQVKLVESRPAFFAWLCATPKLVDVLKNRSEKWVSLGHDDPAEIPDNVDLIFTPNEVHSRKLNDVIGKIE